MMMEPAHVDVTEPDGRTTAEFGFTPTDEGGTPPATVFVVDDDPAVCKTLKSVIGSIGVSVECFGLAEDFLGAFDPSEAECVVLDLSLPKMSGLELLTLLTGRHETPVVVFSGNDDTTAAVRSLKLGAVDFCAKSAGVGALLDCVRRAVTLGRRRRGEFARRQDAVKRIGALTRREREVMVLLATGKTSKEIAGLLGISHRTVESHRANIMRKTGSGSLASLIRLFLISTSYDLGAGKSGLG
jgi:FixJ family two-component response regulator